MSSIRLIAFYLPQFHPIAENDEWWGKGFTEWTNVAKAKPLFPGHYQPHIPADLGFYDLRLPEARRAQAELAREYGIHGFCYYHYWFQGKRLLGRPFTEVLASGEPDFPFCLCWANESWTRAWNGRGADILMRQEYSEQDDKNHFCFLSAAFKDDRYIRYDGKPMFLVYRASILPDPLKTTTIWREGALKAGIGELFLCRVESTAGERGDPAKLGFDAAVEFQPDWTLLRHPLRRNRAWRIASRLGLSPPVYQEMNVLEYRHLVEHSLKKPATSYRRFPSVTPMWDNSARKQAGGTILTGSSPELYEQWLQTVCGRLDSGPDQEVVFINAWNEWAEGNHLEPDLRHGRAYLEATRNASAAK